MKESHVSPNQVEDFLLAEMAKSKKAQMATTKARVADIRKLFADSMPTHDATAFEEKILSRSMDAKITGCMLRLVTHRDQHLREMIKRYCDELKRADRPVPSTEIHNFYGKVVGIARKMSAYCQHRLTRDITLSYFPTLHYLLFTKVFVLGPFITTDHMKNLVTQMYDSERRYHLSLQWELVAMEIREAFDLQIQDEVGVEALTHEVLVEKNTDMIAGQLAGAYLEDLEYAEQKMLGLCASTTQVALLDLFNTHDTAFRERDQASLQLLVSMAKEHRETILAFKSALRPGRKLPAPDSTSRIAQTHLARLLLHEPDGDGDKSRNSSPVDGFAMKRQDCVSTRNQDLYILLTDLLQCVKLKGGLGHVMRERAKATIRNTLAAIGTTEIATAVVTGGILRMEGMFRENFERITEGWNKELKKLCDDGTNRSEALTFEELMDFTETCYQEADDRIIRGYLLAHYRVVVGLLIESSDSKSDNDVFVLGK